jgi:predicted TIM-barrel fold metal-dependent hydrolase
MIRGMSAKMPVSGATIRTACTADILSFLCVLFVLCLELARPASAQQRAEIPFIDAHVHMNRPAALLQLMDQAGLDKAVVFWGRHSDNQALAAAAEKHPKRLIAFVSISPERRHYRDFWKKDDPKLLAELEAALKSGAFKGIGEISVVHFPSRGFPEADFDPLGALMRGIMGLAERYRVPVTVHCEITRLREFKRLLEAFPAVPVIWAHGGYTPYFLARRMIENHPNLTYELSARSYLGHPRSPDYTIFRNTSEVWPRWLELIESHPRRFIVGTDGSQRRLSSDQIKIDRLRLLLSQLTPTTRSLVATGNIMRLVGD